MAIEEGILAPRGEWAVIHGKTKDSSDRAFLFNLISGKWLRIRLRGNPFGPGSSFSFAADGRRAAWIEPASASESIAVVEDLVSLAPVKAARSLALSSEARLALSPDASHLAVLDGSALIVVDLRTDKVRLRAAVPSAKRKPYFIVFPSSAVVRLYPGQRFEPSSAANPRIDEIVEVDIATGRSSVTGLVESDLPGMFLRPSADGERILALEHQRTRVTLRAGRTGELITALATRGKLRCAAFLTDGGVAVVERQPVGSLLQIFSASGVEAQAISMPVESGAVSIAGEVAPGRLLLGLNPKNQNDRQHWTFFLVDISNGKILAEIPGLIPLMPMEFWWAPALRPADLAGNATTFFLGKDGSLVRFDPLSGHRRRVL